MDEWKLPWDGGCRCGETRIRISAPPLLASACHCTGCQRMTASAFSLTLTVPAEGFAVIAGEPTIGGLHGAIGHYFCPRCKSWMFTRPMKDFVNVRPSALDDQGWFVPFAEFFTDEKLPWANTPAVHSFPSAPEFEVYASLMEEFCKSGARPEQAAA